MTKSIPSLGLLALASLAPAGVSQDCNQNGVDDAIDLVTGTSFDCNGNGIPDECDFCSADVTLVDFEGLPESTAIGSQYAADGVTFALLGSPPGLPIICSEGSPTVGFTGAGSDTPLGGINGLTDPTGGTWGIEISFSPPVDDPSFYIVDIDGNESVEVRGFVGASLVTSQVFTGADLETGNGVGTLVNLLVDGITRIEVDVSSGTGYAIDTLLFRRPAANQGCDRFVRVSQESAPGAGDFDTNVLGFVELFPTGTSTVATQYSYDFPESDSYNGLLLPQVPDRSNLAFIETADHGLSLFVFHDRAVPNDADGGRAEMSFALTGDPDGAEIALQDDPDTDVYTGAPGSNLFTGRWNWNACCTDGFVLGDIEGDWEWIVQFTDVGGGASTVPIQGLTSWRVHSADGKPVDLALALDRRVRLDKGNGPCALSLVPDQVDLSITTGGVQTLSLLAGPSRAGSLYLLLGTASGTQPGQTFGSSVLRLNPGPYFSLTLGLAAGGFLTPQVGVLDPLGGATAQFVLPPGLPPSLAGLVVHHAYVLVGDPFASNPCPVRLVP